MDRPNNLKFMAAVPSKLSQASIFCQGLTVNIKNIQFAILCSKTKGFSENFCRNISNSKYTLANRFHQMALIRLSIINKMPRKLKYILFRL